MVSDEKSQFSVKSTFNMNKNRQKFRQIDEIVLAFAWKIFHEIRLQQQFLMFTVNQFQGI